MRIRVIIADDHQMVREGLSHMLGSERDIEVLAQAIDGKSTVRLTQKLIPDIVIMDINMPGLNGIEATRQIKAEFPEVKVIALSMHSYRIFIIEMFNAGASGYLLKNCAFDELANAIRIVVAGKKYISPSLMGDAFIENYAQDLVLSEPSVFSVLSQEEQEVFHLFAEGKTTKAIAKRLKIALEIVEAHLSKILKELNLDNLEELTKYAIQERIIPPKPLSSK